MSRTSGGEGFKGENPLIFNGNLDRARERGRKGATKSNNGSTFFDINPRTMRQHVLVKSLGRVLSLPLALLKVCPTNVHGRLVGLWSILMKCRFSLVGIAAVWSVIFPHSSAFAVLLNAPFTNLFSARDVPFAQGIIRCNRDWSPKRRLSKPFELLYDMGKTR